MYFPIFNKISSKIHFNTSGRKPWSPMPGLSKWKRIKRVSLSIYPTIYLPSFLSIYIYSWLWEIVKIGGQSKREYPSIQKKPHSKTNVLAWRDKFVFVTSLKGSSNHFFPHFSDNSLGGGGGILRNLFVFVWIITVLVVFNPKQRLISNGGRGFGGWERLFCSTRMKQSFEVIPQTKNVDYPPIASLAPSNKKACTSFTMAELMLSKGILLGGTKKVIMILKKKSSNFLI